MGTRGSFPGGKAVGGVKLTIHIRLVPRSRMHGAVSPLPITSSWRGAKHRDKFTFTYIYTYARSFQCTADWHCKPHSRYQITKVDRKAKFSVRGNSFHVLCRCRCPTRVSPQAGRSPTLAPDAACEGAAPHPPRLRTRTTGNSHSRGPYSALTSRAVSAGAAAVAAPGEYATLSNIRCSTRGRRMNISILVALFIYLSSIFTSFFPLFVSVSFLVLLLSSLVPFYVYLLFIITGHNHPCECDAHVSFNIM
jgi:hypothetical protein